MGILDKLIIAIAGSQLHDTPHIRRWIEANGGKYSANVKKGVTHLIASKDAYRNAASKKATDPVQQATDMGIWIVSYDWFEDSLHAKRKLSAKKYTWEVIRKEKRKKKELKRMGPIIDGKKFRDGCEQARELTGSGTSKKARKPKPSKSFFFSTSTLSISSTPYVSAAEDLRRRKAEREVAQAAGSGVAEGQTGALIEIGDDLPDHASLVPKPAASTRPAPKKTKNPSPSSSMKARGTSVTGTKAKTGHWKANYHYYQDVTGFDYKIILVRSDFSTTGFARYHIGLLESHAKPHTYWTIVQYAPAAKLAPPAVDGHPEAARLLALVTKPAPVSDVPYTNTLCPANSTYATAYRAFRHAFRDLTLLSWEERFDKNSAIQKARAVRLGIEPFVYSKPPMGMPMGMLPQEGGLYQGDTTGLEVRGDIEDGYTRNDFNLPSLSAPLTKNGGIGAILHREAAD
ncbi:hypothetical protein EJ02DRAFT_298176, partial [Clathrospora elynae]